MNLRWGGDKNLVENLLREMNKFLASEWGLPLSPSKENRELSGTTKYCSELTF